MCASSSVQEGTEAEQKEQSEEEEENPDAELLRLPVVELKRRVRAAGVRARLWSCECCFYFRHLPLTAPARTSIILQLDSALLIANARRLTMGRGHWPRLPPKVNPPRTLRNPRRG